MRIKQRATYGYISLSLTLLLSGCSVFGSSKPTRTQGVYRVQQGDTLHAIGLKYGVSDESLRDLNDIDDPRKLQVGQMLQVPAASRARAMRPRDLSFAASTAPRPDTDNVPLKRVKLGGVRGYVGALRMPVSKARLTSSFGWRSSRFHEGADLAAPHGTPIRAAHDGNVVYASERFGGYGRVVVIKGDRFLTVYAHNSRNRVRVGESVKKGDWIADVGQSGDASGPHLHFETRVRDESGRYAAVDPFTFFARSPES